MRSLRPRRPRPREPAPWEPSGDWAQQPLVPGVGACWWFLSGTRWAQKELCAPWETKPRAGRGGVESVRGRHCLAALGGSMRLSRTSRDRSCCSEGLGPRVRRGVRSHLRT